MAVFHRGHRHKIDSWGYQNSQQYSISWGRHHHKNVFEPSQKYVCLGVKIRHDKFLAPATIIHLKIHAYNNHNKIQFAIHIQSQIFFFNARGVSYQLSSSLLSLWGEEGRSSAVVRMWGQWVLERNALARSEHLHLAATAAAVKDCWKERCNVQLFSHHRQHHMPSEIQGFPVTAKAPLPTTIEGTHHFRVLSLYS
jgi:hypothetical protein